MYQQYLEFLAKPFGLDNPHFLINKLFNRLHGVMASQKLSLGLGFPDLMSDQNGKASPGHRILVFGPADHLKQVMENPGILALVNRGMVDQSGISQVPDNARPVAYVRWRNKTGLTAQGIKRELRRFKKRAPKREEVWDESQVMDRFNLYCKKRRKDESEKKQRPYLLVEREGGRFPIYLESKSFITDEQKAQKPCFNKYGLGNGPHLSWVYRF